LAEAAAPSDSLVFGRRVQIYLLTYLLTYLPTLIGTSEPWKNEVNDSKFSHLANFIKAINLH